MNRLTMGQTKKLLKCCEGVVVKLVKNGELTCHRDENGKAIHGFMQRFFDKDEVAALMEKGFLKGKSLYRKNGNGRLEKVEKTVPASQEPLPFFPISTFSILVFVQNAIRSLQELEQKILEQQKNERGEK